MSWHYLEKAFYDYADTIEGVNIHYVWTPAGGAPDWEHQRVTRFMPLVHSALPIDRSTSPTSEVSPSQGPRLRKKILKLPPRILDPQSGTLTDRYFLHHYFEVFQDGYRRYSPLYTEEISTGAGNELQAHNTEGAGAPSSAPLPQVDANVKQLKE